MLRAVSPRSDPPPDPPADPLPEAAWCRVDAASGATTVAAGGAWLLAGAVRFDRLLDEAGRGATGRLVLDLGSIVSMDTTGAWLLARTARAAGARGVAVDWQGLPARFQPLLDLVASDCTHPPVQIPPRHTFVHFLDRIGRAVETVWLQAVAILNFTGSVAIDSLAILVEPRRLRLAAVLTQVEAAGLNAVPILALLSFLIGVVMAYQSSEQLHRYGADIYTVNLLAISILRELGAMLAAIIVAGRSGSAFAAEIGVMEVNEEVDAIETIGMDVVGTLILPRMLGLLIALPLLTFLADVAGIAGGAVVCYFALQIPLSVFFNQLHQAIYGWTFWIGLIKAPFFALLIATVGCLEGLRVERNASGVGRHTTSAVVESLFLVIVADAAFSVLFQVMDL